MLRAVQCAAIRDHVLTDRSIMGWYRRSTVLASASDAAVAGFDADLSRLMVGDGRTCGARGQPQIDQGPGPDAA
jgi:hypothetical protein